MAKIVGAITKTYVYDGDQIIADYNEAGAWKRRYYYGPGIDEPICMIVVLSPGSEVMGLSCSLPAVCCELMTVILLVLFDEPAAVANIIQRRNQRR